MKVKGPLLLAAVLAALLACPAGAQQAPATTTPQAPPSAAANPQAQPMDPSMDHASMDHATANHGASLFLMQLDHSLKMVGLATSYQLIIQGAAIAVGMWLSEATSRVVRRY